MIKRIISGAIGLPILIYIIYTGGVLLQVALAILSLIGLHEFYRAISGKFTTFNNIGYGFTILYYFFISNSNDDLKMLIYVSAMLALFVYLVFNYPKYTISDVAMTFFGIMYIPILFSYIYFVKELNWGNTFVWLIIITAFSSDTFAYFTGISIGKNKLVPNLSPNKTIEGALGGIAGSMIVSAIYGYIISPYFVDVGNKFSVTIVFMTIGFTSSIFAQFGDLTASSIKRFTGIKDFGNIIPGHGGILDRFDSVIFTAPVVFITVTLLAYLVSWL